MCLLVACTGFAQSYGGYELDRAKGEMERGNYRYALEQFRWVSQNTNFSADVRREGAYFTGFCCVKMSDPWGAIDAFERFLDKYNRSADTRLVPDALYVLGRTYEEVGRNDKAANVYRRCVDRFPYNDFANKSRDRLRIVGGGGYDNGGSSGRVTPEVMDMIDLARRYPDAFSCDQMLLKAVNRAQVGADFVAISKAMRNQFSQSQLFEAVVLHRVFRVMSTYEVVDLAKTTNNAFARNQLLLAAARKNARTAQDFRTLADATTDHFTKSEILRMASDSLGRPQYSMTAVDQEVVPSFSVMANTEVVPAKEVVPASTKNQKTTKSDPFAGFSMDKSRIERVNAFVDSVKAKKGMKPAAEKLSKDDLNLSVVQESMKEFKTIQQFESLHQK
jgi:hypothetical protein